jgi:2-hydroxychromene-2-carboxylate isomerase
MKAIFKIWRGNAKRGEFHEYSTEVAEGMVVLDAVHQIQATQARDLAKALYKAFFVDGIDISAPAAVIEVARSVGVDAAALASALEDPALKERAKKEVDNAIAANVFGSPFFIADGEPFWGVDRMPMLEQWLRSGGW